MKPALIGHSFGGLLTYEQFHFAFANAVDGEEAKQVHETDAVPACGAPLSRRPEPI